MKSTIVRRFGICLLAPLVILTIMTGPAPEANASTDLPDYVIAQFGAPPPTPPGPLSDNVQTAVKQAVTNAVDQANWDRTDNTAFGTLAASKDPRLAWIITDMMRFTWRPEFHQTLKHTATSLLGIELKTIRHRAEITDHLMAWDMPAYPGYVNDKRAIYTNYVPGWERIFVAGEIDWQLVSWGGVKIDDRPYNQTDEVCDCIPAADNPEFSTADEATWLEDDDIVFGIGINGEYRAYPRRIMEIREMVNDTLGGRDLGIPYCSLCGAAQAYFTDQLPEGIERPILRTSGLLIRSNKVMFDINTYSAFDTFRGKAVTGPLAEENLQLEQATVITTDWGSWRTAHPETTVLVEALALGRDYDLRNSRDARGPIFPVGDVDPRLPMQEDVVGVITASGMPVAFQRNTAIAALNDGQEIAFEDVRLKLDAGGIRAVDASGADLGSHEAYWFAWSQFHPQTALWPN